MKLESKHYEKEWLVTEKAVYNAMKWGGSKAEAEEPIKPKAHTPSTSSKPRLLLMDV